MKKGIIKSILFMISLGLVISSCQDNEIVPIIDASLGENMYDIENDGYLVTLSGSELKEGQSGKWYIIRGENGSFEDRTSATTIFSGEPGELYTLEWEISYGNYRESDLMDVSFKAMEIKGANIIPDTIRDTYTIHFGIEQPQFGATCNWEILTADGDGFFPDATIADGAFVGYPKEHYTLKYNQVYGSKIISQEYEVYFDSLVAKAGEDQLGLIVQEAPYFAELPGILPEGAVGKWTVIEGANSTVYKNNNANSLFEGDLKTTYKLLWEVSHGAYTDTDTLLLAFGGINGLWTDERDGQDYRTLTVEGLEWMSENFNYAYAPGSESWYYGLAGNSVIIEYDGVPSGHPLISDEDRKYYGRLYTYSGATLAAPEGWRLPTEDEWDALYDYYGGVQFSAEKLIVGGESGLDLVLNGYFVTPYLSLDPSFDAMTNLGYNWSYLVDGDPNIDLISISAMGGGGDGIAPSIGFQYVNAWYAVGVRYVREVNP